MIAAITISAIFFPVAIFRAGIAIDNSRYAGQLFDGFVSYDEVVAQRRWHKDDNWCSYAVVELSQDAPEALPTPLALSEHKPYPLTDFSGDWQPPPADILADPGGDGRWVHCRNAFGADLYARLQAAARAKGSWSIDRRDVLLVYAPTAGLAFMLSEGN